MYNRRLLFYRDMKLQNKINRIVNGVEYRRWYVYLPKEEVDELNWKEGVELDTKISGNKLVLKPSGK